MWRARHVTTTHRELRARGRGPTLSPCSCLRGLFTAADLAALTETLRRWVVRWFRLRGPLAARRPLGGTRAGVVWGEAWTAPTDVPLIGLSFQCSSISVTETHDTCTFKFRFSTLIVEIKMTIFDRLCDAVCYEHLLHKEEQHGNYDPTSARVFACRSETRE